MPSDAVFKVANLAQHVVQRASFGKLGWKAARMPVVELTTTGRRSGEPRTTFLTSPWREDDTIVVVASAGGNDHHPAWLLNLQADPAVQVKMSGGPRQAMHARVATAEERARLWPLLTAEFKHYAGYQRKTDREIPLVLLQPV